MKISFQDGYSSPAFGAFTLKKNENKLVNKLMSDYINYAKRNARDEICYIYDPYLEKEAKLNADKVFSVEDYFQSLRLKLLQSIEFYKVLPKKLDPASHLTKKLNHTKPSNDDRALFNKSMLLSTNDLTHSDFNKMRDLADTEVSESIYYEDFPCDAAKTGISIIDRTNRFSYNLANKAVEKLNKITK